MYCNKTVAAVIPAHNEQDSVGTVVDELRALLGPGSSTLFDDIVVCDNASTDRTAMRARDAGARVVYQAELGYGVACLTAIGILKQPDIVVFVDADHSVVADEVMLLLAPLRQGADLVVGSRALGHRKPGALTFPQRLGNWLASHTIEWLWQYRVTDLGPFRAICYQSLNRLQMKDRQFGWTVEMQVKAIQAGMNITEVPVISLKRIGRSKISGTLKGCIGAAIGIFSTIYKLRAQEKRLLIDATYKK